MSSVPATLPSLCLAALTLLGGALQSHADGPARPVPSDRQWTWHKRELMAFVHFGPNTFLGHEVGSGRESPNAFAPTALDCRQWCTVFKETGFKAVILTAKHADGFCLWPTTTTAFSVRSSKWKSGKGDVVGELAKACREAGLEFGIYLAATDKSKPTGGPGAAYDALYRAQLRELLTGYGPIMEVWIDAGALPGYDWDSYHATVRELAPQAVIFSDRGPDVRWCGTERGAVGMPNWNTVDLAFLCSGANARDMLYHGKSTGPDWMPAECDVSIRPGWFQHESQTARVKSPEQLMAIYRATVGRGSVLLLNVPPDRRGLLDETDIARLYDFAAARKALFAVDHTPAARIFADGVELPEAQRQALTDADPDTRLAAGASELVATWPEAVDVQTVVLGEYLPAGQRVAEYAVDAHDGTGWQEVARSRTVGFKAILDVPKTRTRQLRVRVLSGIGAPVWNAFGAFASGPGTSKQGDVR